MASPDAVIREEITRLERELEAQRDEFRAVSGLGMKLARALDPGALLPAIVGEARELTRSEAGSLYVRKADRLVFEVAQNDALDHAADGQVQDLPKIELPLDATSLAGLAAAERRVLNIPDVREHASHSRASKDRFHYEVVSMLVVPMVDHRNDVLGVLQLMNAKDGAGRVAPYSLQQAYLCEVLASHAATALEIARLYTELNDVFDSLVRYSAAAIDARDPCTAGHSSRVGSYAVQVAREMGRFSDDELREIRFAGIFHDVGKIGVRECVLTKVDKLAPEGLEIIGTRFQAACESLFRRGGTGCEPDDERAVAMAAELASDLEFVRRVSVPSWLEDADLDRLDAIARRRWTDWRGVEHELLTHAELESLSVRKGNLTPSERREIQNHARMSEAFLEQIPFSKSLALVPRIAGAHHEKMDGSGYPRGLKGEEILLQARIITVVDVFDALTAEDRPYKRPMTPAKALTVIDHEAEAGAYDLEVVATLRRLVERGRFVPTAHGSPDGTEAPFDALREAW